MKKLIIALTVMLTIAASGKAMTYEQARNEALFLTDKMAYELNLTDEQYEAAYEINLDYLMGIASYDDVYGSYWERRNLDLSYIMLDWQWNAFCAASYFYRPLTWSGGCWHFGVYIQYPCRDYFFFGRPVFYATYRGCHAWHVVGGYGYYYSRRSYFCPAGRSHFGMLDRWNRGDYRHSGYISHRNHNGVSNGRYLGGPRNSSTRVTVNQYGRTVGSSQERATNSDRAFSGRGERSGHNSYSNYSSSRNATTNSGRGASFSRYNPSSSASNRSYRSSVSRNHGSETSNTSFRNSNPSSYSRAGSISNGSSRSAASFGGSRSGSFSSSSRMGSFSSGGSRGASFSSGGSRGGGFSGGGSRGSSHGGRSLGGHR